MVTAPRAALTRALTLADVSNAVPELALRLTSPLTERTAGAFVNVRA
jgi:hypothetical protein